MLLVYTDYLGKEHPVNLLTSIYEEVSASCVKKILC